MNTMYGAVSSRKQEIATLKSLGFGNFSIVFSVVMEALLLSMIGGLAASIFSYLAFDGFTASTIGTNTQVAFQFDVSIELVTTGVLLATGLGVIGGLLPAISATRTPITTALRDV